MPVHCQNYVSCEASLETNPGQPRDRPPVSSWTGIPLGTAPGWCGASHGAILQSRQCPLTANYCPWQWYCGERCRTASEPPMSFQPRMVWTSGIHNQLQNSWCIYWWGEAVSSESRAASWAWKDIRAFPSSVTVGGHIERRDRDNWPVKF